MQIVLMPQPPHSAAPGHQISDLAGAPAGSVLQLHTLMPCTQAGWPAVPHGVLLVLTDGIGKAVIDGAAQRVAAPCVLRLPAGSELRLLNQGAAPMRLVVMYPVAHRDADGDVEGDVEGDADGDAGADGTDRSD
ncbi:MAG: hypothetical protein REI94_14540 [Moraxellaceae bacterium]|nr:hypothetical protein [Moraxellaceae bacterium]